MQLATDSLLDALEAAEIPAGAYTVRHDEGDLLIDMTCSSISAARFVRSLADVLDVEDGKDGREIRRRVSVSRRTTTGVTLRYAGVSLAGDLPEIA